jgi:asparagine synthase (glutamine-hydrolysing)
MIREVIAGALLRPFSTLDPRKARLLRLRLDHLTYLSMKDLANLQGAVRDVERNNVEGVFIEAGCALGGSAIAIGMAKAQQRELILYDTFEMIPPPSERDLADVHERYEVIKSGKAKGIYEISSVHQKLHVRRLQGA